MLQSAERRAIRGFRGQRCDDDSRKGTSHAPSCGLFCGHVRMWIIQMLGTEAMGSSGRRDGGVSVSEQHRGKESGGVGVKFDEHRVKQRFRSCAYLLSIHFHVSAIFGVDTFCLSNFFSFVKNFTDASPYGKDTGLVPIIILLLSLMCLRSVLIRERNKTRTTGRRHKRKRTDSSQVSPSS